MSSRFNLPPARLDCEAVAAMVDEHLRDPFALANSRAAGGAPIVTELLRLAYLGATAEREVGIDPSTRNETVVQAIASRWARMVGTP